MGLITETPQNYYESEDLGNYRYISLKDVVNNFMLAYVGDGKVIPQARRADVLFHAKRAIQEFSYDISRVEKIYEIELPSTLSLAMPQDYVDKVKLTWIDRGGIEHPIYEARFTSNPSNSVTQDDDGEILFDGDEEIIEGEPVTSERFKSFNTDKITGNWFDDQYIYNDYDYLGRSVYGQRYGGTPELMQVNGFYIIDEANGKLSFSSDLVGKIINIHYVSDGLGTDAEMKVHKFAEEAIYAHVRHGILSSRVGVPEYQINRFKKDCTVAKRKAKIRLSKLNLEELTQTMRNKSKRIK